jgi:GxxExxY protein
LKCETEKAINVYYEGKVVGVFYADIVVEDKVILELKAVETFCKEHQIQLINYLKATNLEVGLLLNFGKKPEIKRVIYTNDRKE